MEIEARGIGRDTGEVDLDCFLNFERVVAGARARHASHMRMVDGRNPIRSAFVSMC